MLNFAEVVDFVVNSRREVLDVEREGYYVGAARFNHAAPAEATFHHGRDVVGVLDAIGEDAPARQERTAFAVFGRVVGNAHDDRAHKVVVHRAAELAFERIVAKGNVGVHVGGVDKC